MSTGKLVKVTAAVAPVEAEWIDYELGTLFRWVIKVRAGALARLEVFSDQSDRGFLDMVADILAALGYGILGQWVSGGPASFSTVASALPVATPMWATDPGIVDPYFLSYDPDQSIVRLVYSRELFSDSATQVGDLPQPFSIGVHRTDTYVKGEVSEGRPHVSFSGALDLPASGAHELANFLERAAAVLDDESESPPPHRVVTVERHGGYASRCDCGCGAITPGGFVSRSDAREALARQLER